MCIFLTAFACWGWAALDVKWNDHVTLPRKYWSEYDPTIIGEALYAIATILAFGKLIYFFQIGNHLGPLQVRDNTLCTAHVAYNLYNNTSSPWN